MSCYSQNLLNFKLLIVKLFLCGQKCKQDLSVFASVIFLFLICLFYQIILNCWQITVIILSFQTGRSRQTVYTQDLYSIVEPGSTLFANLSASFEHIPPKKTTLFSNFRIIAAIFNSVEMFWIITVVINACFQHLSEPVDVIKVTLSVTFRLMLQL